MIGNLVIKVETHQSSHVIVTLFSVVFTLEFPFSFAAYTEYLFPVSVQDGGLRMRTSVLSQS